MKKLLAKFILGTFAGAIIGVCVKGLTLLSADDRKEVFICIGFCAALFGITAAVIWATNTLFPGTTNSKGPQ